MNSEELENSLRTEFESYLKTIVAETRQEISQLQEKVEIQLEKQKEQFDVVFQDAFSKINAERELDPGFREAVVEHLRLSKDEGARITATAMAEAEKLQEPTAVEVVDNTAELSEKFRNAVYEISEMTSQAEILKTLVRHAENFASRGAFFIIKNEHFVGWRTFGAQKPENDGLIKEIFFPTSSATILGSSVKTNLTETSTNADYEDANLYLNKIGYESPVNQTAIPLVVRGRGVAALYADGSDLNIQALETLVRIAGLTVDLLASARTPAPKTSIAAIPAIESPIVENMPEPETVSSFEVEQEVEKYQPIETFEPVPVFTESFSPVETESFSPVEYEQIEEVKEVEPEQIGFVEETFVAEAPALVELEEEKFKEFETTSAWDEPKYEAEDYSKDFKIEPSEPIVSAEDISFDSNDSVPDFKTESQFDIKENYDFESPKTVDYPFESTAFEVPKTEEFADFSSTQAFLKDDFETITKSEEVKPFEIEKPVVSEVESVPVEVVSETVAEVAPKPRFSDRNVDLPIDVAEDERRLHNDARRFARLLVSEIKLYNEQKVKEGRESNDLYERLKEAIDRSREMYDKRVQPPVAANFVYFHYELVNTLAESEESKLGVSYPGATV